jgi:N utilization substance protein A
MRVQSVVQELRGEKIDIVQWTEDAVQFVHNALSPAKVVRIEVDEEEKTMQVLVAEDQLSLAIGKRGQNVRLAAKLTNWKIDIRNAQETGADSERQEALRLAESVFQPAKAHEEDDGGATEQQDASSASPVNAVPSEC